MNSSSNQPGKLAQIIHSSTHQGRRSYQEDRHGHWSGDFGGQPAHFAVVIDGAGGHGGGAEAAEAALQAAEAAWKSNRTENPDQFLKDLITSAHEKVNRAGNEIQRSARAVVVACLTNDREAHWVHAGDSRLLRFHDGEFAERTRDDSVVQVLFERGEITEEEMGTHPDQSRLLQSLGGDEPATPRLGKSALSPGDVLILCTDGFWEHLTRRELEKLVATPAKKRQSALDKAVDLAVRRGGPKADNTTAIMIHCGESDGSPASRPWLIWLLLIIALASLATWWASTQAWWPGPFARSPQAPITSPTEGPTSPAAEAPAPPPAPIIPPEEVEPTQSEPPDQAAETPPPWPRHPARSPQSIEPEKENPTEP
jgi:serine/threonine protein phosphatase PrpC